MGKENEKRKKEKSKDEEVDGKKEEKRRKKGFPAPWEVERRQTDRQTGRRD